MTIGFDVCPIKEKQDTKKAISIKKNFIVTHLIVLQPLSKSKKEASKI